MVEILRHDEHAMGAGLQAEAAALAAFLVDDHVIHASLPFFS
jgi:hypothetical protein